MALEIDNRIEESSGGVVYVGHLVISPETGEEVEEIHAIECKQCQNTDRRFKQEVLVRWVDGHDESNTHNVRKQFRLQPDTHQSNES